MRKFDQEELNIPIAKVAEALGLREGRRDFYYSPMREEKEASLHIDRTKNVWHDHGNGMGGTVAQLVMVTRQCSKREAYEFLRSLDPTIAPEHLPVEKQPRQVKSIRGISCYYLQKYLDIRKIPLDLARQYCKQITTFDPEKGMNYTWVGFPNNAGGWALASPRGLKSSTGGGITTINTEGRVTSVPSSNTVAIFEGFWDFLSWQVMQCSSKPSCDMLVLNSVANIDKARDYIAAHEKAVCFLDNDEAGQKCTHAVENLCQGKEVIDMSDLYGKHNDLNEMLQASRGYSSEMNLSMHM